MTNEERALLGRLYELARDKRLTNEEQASLQAYLARNPEQAAWWRAAEATDRRVRDGLRHELGVEALSPQASARIRARLRAEQRSWRPRLLVQTATALLLFVGALFVVATLLTTRPQTGSPNPLQPSTAPTLLPTEPKPSDTLVPLPEPTPSGTPQPIDGAFYATPTLANSATAYVAMTADRATVEAIEAVYGPTQTAEAARYPLGTPTFETAIQMPMATAPLNTSPTPTSTYNPTANVYLTQTALTAPTETALAEQFATADAAFGATLTAAALTPLPTTPPPPPNVNGNVAAGTPTPTTQRRSPTPTPYSPYPPPISTTPTAQPSGPTPTATPVMRP